MIPSSSISLFDSSWTPNQGTGFVAALDVKTSFNQGKIWQDRARTTLVSASGQLIGSIQCPWSGLYFTAGTDASRPIFIINTGKYYVDFGGSHYLRNDAGIASGVNASTYVLQYSAVDPVGLLDSAPLTANIIRNYPSGWWDWHDADPQVPLLLTLNQWNYLSFIRKFTTIRNIVYRRNGVQISSSDGSNSNVVSWNRPVIGGINLGGAGFYNGRLSCMMFYNATHLSNDHLNIENYLAAY